jgi:uncharacterized integral membrane protein (TIGR00698 family)
VSSTEAAPVRARRVQVAAFVSAVFLCACGYLIDHGLRRAGIAAGPSPAIIALLTGAILRNLLPELAMLSPGLRTTMRVTIAPAIVLIGAGLDLRILGAEQIGLTGFAVTLLVMVVGFGAAYVASRLLGLSRRAAVLLGAGTSVCGNSAIVAVAPLVRADDEDLVLPLGAVNLFGVLIMLALPPLALAWGMNELAAGIWAGTTVHAVPQAVAAGAAVGETAGEVATLFKLVRVAMLAPLVLLIALVAARRDTNHPRGFDLRRAAALVPWFVWGFIALAAINTAGLLRPEIAPMEASDGSAMTLSEVLRLGGKILLAIALAAIGLEINARQLLAVGGRALGAGLMSTLVLAFAAYALIIALM